MRKRRNNGYRKYARWAKSGKKLEEFLKINDAVDPDFVNYFLENGKKISQSDRQTIQFSEPYDVVGGTPIFDTLFREDTEYPWRYIGQCYWGEIINRNARIARRIYVCSRYADRTDAGRFFNARLACAVAKDIAADGGIPVVPHLYFPQFMDDTNAPERSFAMEAGKMLLDECDEMRLIVVNGVISEGMEDEIEYMNWLRGDIYRLDLTKQEAEEYVNKMR